MKGLKGSSRQIGDASDHMSAASHSLAEGAGEQSASLQQSSASLEEISAMTRQNAENSHQADLLTTAASRLVQHAGSMKQLAARVVRMRRNELRANRQKAAPAGGLRALVALSILSAASVIFGLNWMEARHQLSMERARLKENLDYYSYRYESAQRLQLQADAGDTIVGERAVAPHQIILFYKQSGGHCQAAREKMTAVVKRHENAVHLILKDVQRLTDVERNLLKEQISKLPSVFVYGKHAAGWEVPGFLERFTLDCGC